MLKCQTEDFFVAFERGSQEFGNKNNQFAKFKFLVSTFQLLIPISI
mgnify:FL=1